MFVKNPDLEALKKVEMFAHTLAEKLGKLREQVEAGAQAPTWCGESWAAQKILPSTSRTPSRRHPLMGESV